MSYVKIAANFSEVPGCNNGMRNSVFGRPFNAVESKNLAQTRQWAWAVSALGRNNGVHRAVVRPCFVEAYVVAAAEQQHAMAI